MLIWRIKSYGEKKMDDRWGARKFFRLNDVVVKSVFLQCCKKTLFRIIYKTPTVIKKVLYYCNNDYEIRKTKKAEV